MNNSSKIIDNDDTNSKEEYDIQKELEAKFDELFGPIDDEDSDDQFRMLSQGYTDEQNQLKAEISDLNQTIQELQSQTANTARFAALAKKYTDITELTQEILHTFVSRIEVHEKLKDDNGSVTQEIDIYFTHIGIVK